MKSPTPPKWADRFLEWFCKPELLDFLQGDLHELYQKRTKNKGQRNANVHFILDVLSVCRPFALRKSRSNSNTYAMFKNYYKVAIRNLLRHKMYSAIKIGGFALGIAACILIALFINEEITYDSFYKDGDNIYRIINQWNEKGNEDKWPAFQAPMAGVIREEIPEIEKVGRMIPYDWYLAGGNLLKKVGATQNTYEEGFVYADQDFIEILNFPMVHGSIKTALSEPNSILLTKSKADKYFPNKNPVGESIILNDDQENPLTIGGVMEDLPSTTHLTFDFIITLTGQEFWPGEQTNWCCSNYNTYIKVRDDADIDSIIEKLYTIRDNYMITYLKDLNRSDTDKFEEYRGFELQPVEDIHLYSAGIYDYHPNGDIKIIWMFGIVASLILFLACINFINLSTAKSANRAKEVGLRKVVGSYKSDLIKQFLTESIVFSLISFTIGIILAILFLPYFNTIANKSLEFPWISWWFVPSLLVSIISIGFLAGLYPSFYLSSFRPIEVLKGKLRLGGKNASLQSVLVIFQFSASVVLIVGALVVNKQMSFILNSNLGYNKEQVVLLHGTNTLNDKLEPLKNELLALSEVKSITSTSYFPVSGTKRDGNQFWLEGRQELDPGIGSQKWRVDHEYVQTMEMEIVEGRNFSNDLISDTASIIVNEAFVQELGKDDPLGLKVENFEYPRTIIGVVKNFHFEPISGEVEPLTLVLGNETQITALKLSSNNLIQTMDEIHHIWNQVTPNQGIRYEFLDEVFATMYEHVKRTGQIFTAFSILAVSIACLGLFALSAFMIEQRRKEISIRKVLGASLAGLFQTLTSNFLKLIIIALTLALPLGWYIMNQWLQNYKYKIDMNWELFAFSGILIVFISLFTISYEIIRAVRINPAETLHSE